jgi:CMP-N,N'-diacetyllegionaminic acid synthase
MKRIVVIPARGGSKGVPGKNIKFLNGKPMIHYTIEAAREVFKDDEIIVSTDSNDIKECVEQIGLKVPFLRPDSLATDMSTSHDVLIHVIEYLVKINQYPEQLILLQPTSPFRSALHIREALALFTPEIDMVVSVKESKSNPYFNLFEENKDGFLEKSKSGVYSRRQDCPAIWEYNGAIYIINIKSLKEHKSLMFPRVIKYEMDEFSSHDIDTPFDWKMAELFVNEIKKERD